MSVVIGPEVRPPWPIRRVIDALETVNKPTSEAPDAVELGGSVVQVKEEEECRHCSDFGYF